MRDEEQEKTSEHGHGADHANDGTLLAGPGGHPGGTEDDDELHDPKGDVEQDGLELVEAKVLDDEAAEHANSTTGDASVDVSLRTLLCTQYC